MINNNADIIRCSRGKQTACALEILTSLDKFLHKACFSPVLCTPHEGPALNICVPGSQGTPQIYRSICTDKHSSRAIIPVHPCLSLHCPSACCHQRSIMLCPSQDSICAAAVAVRVPYRFPLSPDAKHGIPMSRQFISISCGCSCACPLPPA